jgi:predicted amidophosphoribosyltransferase
VTAFCPACFQEMSPTEAVCPDCGAAVEDWARTHSYGERLIRALSHPLAEARMRAILALGSRGEPSAAMPLARCALATPADVVQGLEVVRSIERLPACAERTRALERLRRHPASAVRRRVARVAAPGMGPTAGGSEKR